MRPFKRVVSTHQLASQTQAECVWGQDRRRSMAIKYETHHTLGLQKILKPRAKSVIWASGYYLVRQNWQRFKQEMRLRISLGHQTEPEFSKNWNGALGWGEGAEDATVKTWKSWVRKETPVVTEADCSQDSLGFPGHGNGRRFWSAERQACWICTKYSMGNMIIHITELSCLKHVCPTFCDRLLHNLLIGFSINTRSSLLF